MIIVSSFSANAQQVNGNWYGLGTVISNGVNSSYMAEMQLKQTGKKVTGTLNYYFRDSLFSAPLNGVFDAAKRRLIINPVQMIYYRSTSTVNGIDCMLSGSFTLLTSKTGSTLTGAFTSDAEHRYTVPPLNFRFHLSNDTAAIVIETGLEDRGDTATAAVIAPQVTDTVTATMRNDFLLRGKDLAKEVIIHSSTVRVELYDNGTIDNDSVSLFLNNREVLPASRLTHKAIRLTLTLDPNLEYNELSMFAENLGAIPPNTAALILYDGNVRHELILTSDFNKSATIRLKRKQQ